MWVLFYKKTIVVAYEGEIYYRVLKYGKQNWKLKLAMFQIRRGEKGTGYYIDSLLTNAWQQPYAELHKCLHV